LIFALGQRLNSALIKGSSLKRIVTANKFIPREIVTFMSSGETVPEMANSMAAYAKLMFEEIINRTNRLIGLIQPAMFLIIGVTIVFTYFQLLLPIYDSVKEMY
jgi:competence protein ComGB